MDRRMRAKLVVDAGWRRRWWMLCPIVVGLAASALLASSLPKIYRASTTILVMQQGVRGDTVVSMDSPRVEDRVRNLTIQITSRRWLERVIRELGMAPSDASESELEDAYARLSSNVDLDWDKHELSWFSISVRDRNPKRAAAIVNRLGELLIEQASRSRGARAKSTAETDQGWLEKTEEDLRQRDAELNRYNEALAVLDRRAKKLDEMRDQESAPAQPFGGAQTRIQQLTDAIQWRSDRVATLLAEDKAQPVPTVVPVAPAPSDDLNARALARMQRELQDLLKNYGEKHSLVTRKREQIQQFVASHPALRLPPSMASEDRPSNSLEIERLKGEIRSLEADRERVQQNVDTQSRRSAIVPTRQQELAALARDYESLQRQYDANVAQQGATGRALAVAAPANGEQFQIRDRARPPLKPYQPNVPRIVLLGLLGGLLSGVGLASLLEAVDQTVRSEDEFIHRYPDLPILVTIPNLEPDAKVQGVGPGRYRPSKIKLGGPLA